jgi:hypothetical protein
VRGEKRADPKEEIGKNPFLSFFLQRLFSGARRRRCFAPGKFGPITASGERAVGRGREGPGGAGWGRGMGG